LRDLTITHVFSMLKQKLESSATMQLPNKEMPASCGSRVS